MSGGGGGDSSASSTSVPSSSGSTGSSSGASSTSSTPERSAAPANDNGKPRAANDNAQQPAEQAEKPKWYREKAKLKRGGQERELTVEEALSMLSDDYEHEVTVSGESRKAKYTDLVRGYQKSSGAEQLMRQAADLKKQIAEQIEYGKKDPGWVLENVLGIENRREWAKEQVREMIREEAELNALLESDPGEYHKRIEARVRADLERRNGFQTQRQQREAQAKAAQEQRAQAEAKARELIKAAGLPPSALGRVGEVMRKYQELGYSGTLEEAVAEAREAYVSETFGWFDAHDDEKLLELLGPERRKRLRELELSKVKPRPAAKESEREESSAPRRGAETKEISEAEFRRQFMRR